MADPTPAATRRVPTQARSRKRVERVLDSAETLVVRDGVDALTTREIARAAGIPVASLYQYFADKDAVLLALAERDMAEMDAEVAADAGRPGRGGLDVAAVVRATMEAFVRVYHRRRAFVEIYLRGRTNAAVHRFGREHNRQVATDLLALRPRRRAGRPGAHRTASRVLAVEVGDRIFQLAFENEDRGDPDLVEEGIALVTTYLERYAA